MSICRFLPGETTGHFLSAAKRNKAVEKDLTFLGMGTKVEGKTYMPGYFAMADFSMNSNGGWLQYYEEKKPNGHLYDSYTIMPTNVSSEYDKEMLKRTMLVHEATFRRQVYELHRLYKIQKDLMAQFQRDEFNRYSRPVDTLQSRSFSSQAPSRDTKRIWQISNDNKQPSLNFMKENSSQYSLNGAPLRFNHVRSMKKMLDLELPDDVYADSDNVEILEEKHVGSLVRTNGAVLGGDVKLSLGNNESSSCRENGWISDLRSQNNRCGYAVNDLNKLVPESADTKLTDFLGGGTSSAQNQCYSSRRVNSNFLGLEGDFKERHVSEASDSNFFGPNEETRQHSIFSNKENDRNVSMAWFRQKPNGIEVSRGNYFACPPSTSHQPVLASPASFVALGAPWETNNTNKSYTVAIGPTGAQNWKQNARSGIDAHPSLNGFCNGFPLDSVHMQHAPHLLKIPGEYPGDGDSALHSHLSSQYPKHLQDANCRKGVNLNHVPPDTVQDGTAIDGIEHGCENSPVEISWLRKKPAGAEPAELKKSQMASSSANGRSQFMFSSGTVAHDSASASQGRECRSGRNEGSDGTTARILGFSISETVEKGSPYSSIPHIETTTKASAMHDAQLKLQTQGKKVDVNVRNLIDLNDALPCMDVPEIDVCQSEGNTVSREPDDSNDSPAITAAENLMAMSKDACPAVSPSQCYTLHWFAELATSKENTIVSGGNGGHRSGDSDDDEFEALTLQLEETKGYEYSCRPRTPEHKNEEDRSVASLLLTRPRRGRARRRRQKKDFQKDILPGLASLSRHEVSEDLQTLGGLMKASGRPMPVSPTRRGGRNGSQPRGRRRPRSVSVTVEEVQVSTPLMPPPLATAADLDADGRSIIGWGRTTRRCRRPRCPPANNASVHLA